MALPVNPPGVVNPWFYQLAYQRTKRVSVLSGSMLVAAGAGALMERVVGIEAVGIAALLTGSLAFALITPQADERATAAGVEKSKRMIDHMLGVGGFFFGQWCGALAAKSVGMGQGVGAIIGGAAVTLVLNSEQAAYATIGGGVLGNIAQYLGAGRLTATLAGASAVAAIVAMVEEGGLRTVVGGGAAAAAIANAVMVGASAKTGLAGLAAKAIVTFGAGVSVAALKGGG